MGTDRREQTDFGLDLTEAAALPPSERLDLTATAATDRRAAADDRADNKSGLKRIANTIAAEESAAHERRAAADARDRAAEQRDEEMATHSSARLAAEQSRSQVETELAVSLRNAAADQRLRIAATRTVETRPGQGAMIRNEIPEAQS